MSVPGIVQSTLDGEEIAARVSLGGEDELFVTPQHTIIYRAEGLLSDESIDEFPHNADRLTLSEGRRKSRFSLEYALEGERDFTVPSSKTESVLHPVLAGLLNGNGITDPGETVARTYRFSELTVIVTSDRLVKHIGGPVWDGDFEQYHFDDVTGLSFEDGSVATQIVIEVEGRPQRIKAPNEEAGDLSERLKRALFAYHDVSSLEELNETVGLEEEDDGDDDPAAAFGDRIEPLDANPPELENEGGIRSTDQAVADAAVDDTDDADSESGDPLEAASSNVGTNASAERRAPPAEATDHREGTDTTTEQGGSSTSVASVPGSETGGFEGSGFEPLTASTDSELLERFEALESTVAEQNALLKRQQRTIETLIEELRQGR